MTSDATSLCLWKALDGGHLIARHPLRRGGETRRRLFVTPEIDRLLDGSDPGSLFPDAEAERVIGRYAAGWLVMVSLSGRPRDRAEPDLERLEGLDEVWALCFRRPRPGWRVFGRFLQQDVFIGLLAYDRIVLNGRRTYAGYAAETIPAWQAMLGHNAPLRGTAIEDYLTGVTRDAD